MIENKYLLLLLVALVSVVSPIKIYYIGGGCNQNSTSVFKSLAEVIPNKLPLPGKCDPNWITTKCPKIAVVTSASSNVTEGNNEYSNDTQSMSYKTMFLIYGIAPQHISVHVDNYKITTNISTAQGKQNVELFKNADIIYFNGGDQALHIRSWLNDDGTPSQLLKILKTRAFNDEVVLAGSSAGAMIWGPETFGSGSSFGTLYFKNSIGLAPKKVSDASLADNRNGTKSLQYSENAGKMPAFGCVDFPTDTHFNVRGRLGRLIPMLVDLKRQFSFGIDENTSIFYDRGVGKVNGQNGVTFVDLSHSLVILGEYFQIKNVTGHYLTEGDTYNFATKNVQSSKPLITTPYYNSSTDSSDIFGAYQVTLLETRLVDQKSLYNFGITKTPFSFPKKTPIFDIKFYKNSQTKGYYSSSNKKYTAVDVVYDFSYGTSSQPYKNKLNFEDD